MTGGDRVRLGEMDPRVRAGTLAVAAAWAGVWAAAETTVVAVARAPKGAADPGPLAVRKVDAAGPVAVKAVAGTSVSSCRGGKRRHRCRRSISR